MGGQPPHAAEGAATLSRHVTAPSSVVKSVGESQGGPLAVGQPVPDFTLVDQYGVDVSLSSARGQRNAVVVFYPAAFSGICRGELRSIREYQCDQSSTNAFDRCLVRFGPRSSSAETRQHSHQGRGRRAPLRGNASS